MHPSHFVHRPVAEHRFAIDVGCGDRPEIAAIIRHCPVISQDEIAVVRYYHFGIRALVGIGSGNVIFFQRFTVHEYLPGFDANAISRQPDDPLDKAFRGIARIAKHDDIATLN